MEKDLTFYTIQETADILKVTYRTIQNYIYSGKLKAVKLGKSYRISEASLREFMQIPEEAAK